jgi:hypothetical protein
VSRARRVTNAITAVAAGLLIAKLVRRSFCQPRIKSDDVITKNAASKLVKSQVLSSKSRHSHY